MLEGVETGPFSHRHWIVTQGHRVYTSEYHVTLAFEARMGDEYNDEIRLILLCPKKPES